MLRVLLVLILLIPMPVWAEDVPGEVTVNEDFSDSTYQDGLTISGGNSDAYIYCSEQGNYNTSGCSLAIVSGTYVFEFSEDVYEVGFIVGAVNNSYDVKYYYSDGTDETIQKSGQSNAEGPPWPNMYDSFYKSFTDYNNDEANTDKFITKFEVTLSDISVLDTLYWQYVDESTIPTTTSSTTTSTTTTSTTTTSSTTTTTTIPPKTEAELEAERIQAAENWERDKNFKETGIRELDSERREREAEEAAELERNIERSENKDKWDCYMTNAQIQRGDCEPYNQMLKAEEEARLEAERIAEEERLAEEKRIAEEKRLEEERLEQERIDAEIKAQEEADAKVELEKLNVDMPEDIVEEYVEVIKEVEEYIEDVVIEETIVDIPDEIIIIVEEVVDEKIQEVAEEVLVEPIQENVEEKPAEIVEVPVEVIVVEEITEEQVEEVQAVVDTAIENVENLTEEQVEVVAEVLQVPTKDVEIIAEVVKTDEVVAEAVEIFVERAVENKDVEDYTLADVVTEIQFEQFIENPIEVLVDFDDIDLSSIGDDMTSDQKEKAQEVVVPVILTRIASMAAFIFRRS
jgi:hypothetical protein